MIDPDIQDSIDAIAADIRNDQPESAVHKVATLLGEALTNMRRVTEALQALASAATPPPIDEGSS